MNLLDLRDHCGVIQVLLEKLLEKTEEVAPDDMDEKSALEFHIASLEMKRLAGDVHRIAEDMFVAVLGDEWRKTIDGTTVEVRRSYNRKWDSPLLAGAVAACVLEGERIAEVDRVVEALVGAARLEWRVTALRDLGIDGDRYCTRELRRASVALL